MRILTWGHGGSSGKPNFAQNCCTFVGFLNTNMSGSGCGCKMIFLVLIEGIPRQ